MLRLQSLAACATASTSQLRAVPRLVVTRATDTEVTTKRNSTASQRKAVSGVRAQSSAATSRKRAQNASSRPSTSRHAEVRSRAVFRMMKVEIVR